MVPSVPMPHPEFTVLLARQRTGTNALRSVLDTSPEIFCFNEVFQPAEAVSSAPIQFRGNYFTFLAEYGAGDVSRTLPQHHEQVLADYLAHLRRLTETRLIVIDVKYNGTHHIGGIYRPMLEPTLFALLKAREVAVLNVVRRNYLRCLLSVRKAWRTGRYSVFDQPNAADVRVSVPVKWALSEMRRWSIEDEIVTDAFAGYRHFKQVEYTELFDADGTIPGAMLEMLRDWFGVEAPFPERPVFRRQSSLPLAETIENMEELAAALRGTPFESCLEDEPVYRSAR